MTTPKKTSQKKTQNTIGEKPVISLHQKLLEVKKTVDFLKKENQGGQYKFVSSSQVLITLRDEMNKRGILLEPHILKTEFFQEPAFNNKKGQWFTELWTLMIWVDADNPEDRIEIPWYSQGVDFHEKGVGKALTYGEKYFLLKYFNIPTDKDDPDYHQDSKQERTRKQETKKQETDKKPIGDIDKELKNFDKISTVKDLEKFRNNLNFFQWSTEQGKELKDLIAEAERNFMAEDKDLQGLSEVV